MLWELGAAGKHSFFFARCVAGFPESKRAVLTASLKHSFEAVGGSAVQITFEDTEVGPAYLCSPESCAFCPLSLHCLSAPFLPCLHSWAAPMILPASKGLPGNTAPALPVLCCRCFCQRCLPVPAIVAGNVGGLQLTYCQHPMLPPATCHCLFMLTNASLLPVGACYRWPPGRLRKSSRSYDPRAARASAPIAPGPHLNF